MKTYCSPNDDEVRRINKVQGDFFSNVVHLFETPLPEGVPERLEKIVASAKINKGNVVLDVGSGTGILVPLIQSYDPQKIFACDLSSAMLARLKAQYTYAETILSDVKDLTLQDSSIDVVFMNACYSNIADKGATFANINRMMKIGGRMVVSHPMGKSFIGLLKEKAPFPMDDFPGRAEAETLFEPYGFEIGKFIDEPKLYILVAIKR